MRKKKSSKTSEKSPSNDDDVGINRSESDYISIEDADTPSPNDSK